MFKHRKMVLMFVSRDCVKLEDQKDYGWSGVWDETWRTAINEDEVEENSSLCE